MVKFAVLPEEVGFLVPVWLLLKDMLFVFDFVFFWFFFFFFCFRLIITIIIFIIVCNRRALQNHIIATREHIQTLWRKSHHPRFKFMLVHILQAHCSILAPKSSCSIIFFCTTTTTTTTSAHARARAHTNSSIGQRQPENTRPDRMPRE